MLDVVCGFRVERQGGIGDGRGAVFLDDGGSGHGWLSRSETDSQRSSHEVRIELCLLSSWFLVSAQIAVIRECDAFVSSMNLRLELIESSGQSQRDMIKSPHYIRSGLAPLRCGQSRR